MNLITALSPAALYAAACWVIFSLFSSFQINPYFFMVLFLGSLVSGILLIVLQRNDDTGEAITLLSGEVIPALPIGTDQAKDDQAIQLYVHWGKTLFFFLSIFILIFWVYPDLSTKFSIFFNNLTLPHFQSHTWCWPYVN